MTIALLIPFKYTTTGREGWIWQTPTEKDLSVEFYSREYALVNRPNGYITMDDGYNRI